MSSVLDEMRNESRQEGMMIGREEGVRIGTEKGIEQGLEKRSKDVALNMLHAGRYAMDEITNISGLTPEEVRELKSRLS